MIEGREPGFIDRTMRGFRRALRIPGNKRGRLKDELSPDLAGDDVDRLHRRIDECLEAKGGEVSARSRAAELGEAYIALAPEGRRRFLEILANDYDVDATAVATAIASHQIASSPEETRTANKALREALVPPRVHLLSQFNGLAQGVKFLVDVRAELIRIARDAPELEPLDADIHRLLSSWFDVGFLTLRRITWETPASLLEKLIEYEAVHAIRSWDDLKHRLSADRRCYAFFHPQMPDEPLIFVQVALVEGISDNVQALLDEDAPYVDPEQANTAVFYSISNCQRGLRGVSFGSFLIKRVADDLQRDLPNVKTFATLSPIPGFRSWLERHAERESTGMFTDAELERLVGITGDHGGVPGLASILGRDGWHEDIDVATAVQPMLLRLCARYLLKGRRHGRAIDRVAHFHLTNGARVERINWLADTSARGLQQSAGMMVNYRYRLSDVEKNHEAYTGDGKVTAASGVRKLVRL